MTQTQDARLQAAATILAGMLAGEGMIPVPKQTMWDSAWENLLGLESAAPESSGNPGELRVEPMLSEWIEARDKLIDDRFVGSAGWCIAVSAEAYRLAAEREAKG